MARFSNVILAGAGAALIAIGIGAQTGTFVHIGPSSFHMPSFGSRAAGAPKHAGVAPQLAPAPKQMGAVPAPEVAPAPPETVNPVPAPPAPVPVVWRGGGDHDGGGDD
jgi:hypothetical protein